MWCHLRPALQLARNSVSALEIGCEPALRCALRPSGPDLESTRDQASAQPRWGACAHAVSALRTRPVDCKADATLDITGGRVGGIAPERSHRSEEHTSELQS